MKSNTDKITRQASVLNKAEVKRRLLQFAKDTRSHKFTRVSAATLDELEGWVETWIRRHVEFLPSKGVTI